MTVRIEVSDEVSDEVDAVFDRDRIIEKGRGTLWSVDVEQVREPVGGHPEVGALSVRPMIGQFSTTTANDSHPRQRSGAHVEARGQHNHIELILVICGRDALLGDPHDRRGPGVNEMHMRQIESLVVLCLERCPLGAIRVIVGAQQLRKLRVVDPLADPLPDVVRRGRVRHRIEDQVVIGRREHPKAATVVVLVVDLAAFFGRVHQRRSHGARIWRAGNAIAGLLPIS